MFILTTNMHTMSEPDTTLPVPPPSVRPYDPSMEFPKDMEEAIRMKDTWLQDYWYNPHTNTFVPNPPSED